MLRSRPLFVQAAMEEVCLSRTNRLERDVEVASSPDTPWDGTTLPAGQSAAQRQRLTRCKLHWAALPFETLAPTNSHAGYFRRQMCTNHTYQIRQHALATKHLHFCQRAASAGRLATLPTRLWLPSFTARRDMLIRCCISAWKN